MTGHDATADAAGDAEADANARANYAATVLADRPRAYWRLGEASGSNASDEAGGLTGTYSGDVTFGQPGALSRDKNSAVDFGGAMGCVRFGNVLGFSRTDSYTLEAWIKPDAQVANPRIILGKLGQVSTSAVNEGFVLLLADGELRLQVCSGALAGCSEASSGAKVALQTFSHVVVTSNGSAAEFFINGASVGAPKALGSVPRSNNHDFTIACPNVGSIQHFDGTLDEIAVYDRVLVAAAIKAHYAAR